MKKKRKKVNRNEGDLFVTGFWTRKAAIAAGDEFPEVCTAVGRQADAALQWINSQAPTVYKLVMLAEAIRVHIDSGVSDVVDREVFYALQRTIDRARARSEREQEQARER